MHSVSLSNPGIYVLRLLLSRPPEITIQPHRPAAADRPSASATPAENDWRAASEARLASLAIHPRESVINVPLSSF